MGVVPELFADFNDLGPTIGLGFFGTHRSLCQLRLALGPGMKVVLWDDGDGAPEMLVDAVVERVTTPQWHPTHNWIARVVPDSFRRVTAAAPRNQSYPCFGCGDDLSATIRQIYLPESRCPHCHELVFAPYLINSA
jgi:DNA-directed RNA polymerase subunit RPC12/RpoP